VAASPAEASAPAHRLKLKGGEERILRDVKLHFQCKDWPGAVRLLEELVQNAPGSAFYRGLLARAMSRHPVMRDNAEKHFIEALRLSPQDAQLHYWLGLYYKSFGLKSRAVNEFRTTLRIDPTHKGARKQFAGGKRGEALGAAFKKFFG
jgi:tetratricopeptide (TPR) repeat protein